MYGLSEKSLSTVTGILKKYPSVRKAILYGSRAKGSYRPGSDIDLTLEVSDDFVRDTLLLMCNDFDDSDLPYFVDLSVKRDISNPDLLSHIERVGKVLWERG